MIAPLTVTVGLVAKTHPLIMDGVNPEMFIYAATALIGCAIAAKLITKLVGVAVRIAIILAGILFAIGGWQLFSPEIVAGIL